MFAAKRSCGLALMATCCVKAANAVNAVTDSQAPGREFESTARNNIFWALSRLAVR